jgi:hypothetical protein
MSVLAAALIDQAKLVSNNRRNAAIADTDWLIFVNWAVESWYKFRISLDPALYFATKDFSLTGGVGAGSSLDLTTGFTAPGLRAVHALDMNPDTGSRMTIRARNFQQRNDGVGPWIPAPFCPVRRYDVRAFVLYITPYENASGAYRIYYRANPYKFASTGDSTPLDAVLEPETEAIVKLAACSGLGIEESDTADPLIQRIGVIKAETAAANDRDDGAACSIADVEDLASGWGYP